MPTYDYRCEACGHEFEEFQSITAGALRKCPDCKKLKLKRLIGGGAAILFKGSGFYETDYRSESYKKAEAKDQGGSGDAKGSSDKKGASQKPQKDKKPASGGTAPDGNKSKKD